MKKILGMLAVGLMLSGVVNTASATNVSTFGAQPCGEWVSVRSDTQANWKVLVQEYWLIGFLSGMAFVTNKDVLKGADLESVSLWMDNYCKTNPLNHTDVGGVALYYELKRKNNIK